MFSDWWFSSRARNGGAVLLGGGLRLQPRIDGVGRPIIDANIGWGRTGSNSRLMFAADAVCSGRCRHIDRSRQNCGAGGINCTPG